MRPMRPGDSILARTGGRDFLTIQPPQVGEPFPVLVPQVDVDGNERDGVRLPEITVPLATYASWNLRDPSIGAPDQRVAFQGSYLLASKKRSGTGEDWRSPQVNLPNAMQMRMITKLGTRAPSTS